ncbi:MAG TPA: SET domain-containing protein-lysine N-methyltransferase, partial [Solirubrobacterales bacterium]|nr:SET domain-containing protein-lysine N-methyltransferase [Solirubrobacterales bacterium]
DFIARAPISAGEEITFDYAMRNYSIEHFPGGCLCGAGNCRGSVTGWKDLPAERKADYEGSVAPYLLEIDRELSASPA